GRGSDKVVRTVYNNVIPSSDLVGTLRLLAREPWGHYRITFEVVDPLRPEARGEVIEIELNADNQESLFRDLDSVWDVLEYTPPWRDVEPTTEEPGEELSAEETPADESQNAAQAEPTRSGDAHDSLSFDAFDLMFAILPAARPLAAFSAFSELSAEWTAPLLAEEAGDEASDELSADLGERVWQQWPARSARNAAVEASFELEADEREAEASGETTALDAVAAAAIAAPALAAAWDALRAGRKAGERTNERASVPGRQEAAGMSR
ncbi:MAG TPA: hypothetical protein VGE52_22315, partial [Pirellulales bacterium]